MRIRPGLGVWIAVCALCAPAAAAAPPAPESSVGSGTVEATQFDLSVTAGPFGENPSGHLTLNGAFTFEATATCLNVSGDAGVAGFRIDSGEDAGMGFLSASGPTPPGGGSVGGSSTTPSSGKTSVLYAGTLATPPTACPPPGAPQPPQLTELGSGPVTGTITDSGGPEPPLPLQQIRFATPTPTAAPGAMAQGTDGTLWFLEPAANSIAFRGNDVSPHTADLVVPRSGAGLSAIAPDVSGSCTNLACASAGMWFTESAANQIGHVTPAGVFAEYPIPTADTKPAAISADAPHGGAWFTEPNANAIGHIDESGHIVEYPVPTPNAQPQGITADEGDTGPAGDGAWFTEAAANKIGYIDGAGTITEYAVPTSAAHPTAIVADSPGAWFVEGGGETLGHVEITGHITEYHISSVASGLVMGTGPDGTSHGAWFSEAALGRLGFISDGLGVISELTLPGSTPVQLAVTDPLGASSLSGYPHSEAVWFSDGVGTDIGMARIPIASGAGFVPTTAPFAGPGHASRIVLSVASRLTVHQGRLALTVACVGSIICRGRVLVRALPHRAKLGATLTAARFTIRAGSRRTLELKVGRATIRTLRHHSIGAVVSVTAVSGVPSLSRRVALALPGVR